MKSKNTVLLKTKLYQCVKNINLKLTAYPNPTIDQLFLRIENIQGKFFNYQLFNMQGKLLLIDKCENNKTHINLNEFPPNTYLLSISENNTVIKSFTIIGLERS